MKLAEDKKKHLVAGIVITVAGGLISLPLAALGIVAGGGKELLDSFGYGNVEAADFWWTAVGSGIGFTILIAYYCLRKRR